MGNFFINEIKAFRDAQQRWGDKMREEQMRQMMGLGAVQVPGGCGAYGSVTIPFYGEAQLARAIEDSIRLRLIEEEYCRHGIEPPKDLARQRKENAELVKRLDREEKKRRLAEAERLVEELRSKEEKRKAAEAEVERLRRELRE